MGKITIELVIMFMVICFIIVDCIVWRSVDNRLECDNQRIGYLIEENMKGKRKLLELETRTEKLQTENAEMKQKLDKLRMKMMIGELKNEKE